MSEPTPFNVELAALRGACEAFEKLDEAATLRALWYLTDRFIKNRKREATPQENEG